GLGAPRIELCTLRGAARDRLDAGRGEAARVRHRLAVHLLVAGAGARGVVVGGGDEAPAEAIGLAVGRGEVADREAVLDGLLRAQARGGLEAVATLGAVEPVLGRRVGGDPPGGAARPRSEPARLDDALLALRLREIAAARAHDLAGPPAAGKEARRRRAADGLALRPFAARAVAELLAVPVTGEDLDHALATRVVVARRERRVEARAGRRVGTPGEPVRDHERRVSPLTQLGEQLGGRRRVLAAVGGELARVDAGRAVGELRHLADVPEEVGVGSEPERAEQRERTERLRGALRPALRQRRDRARRHLVVRLPEQDHVAVSVVGRRGGPHLRPLPAEEGDEIGVGGIARPCVALAHALPGLAPALREEPLRVVVQ